MNIVLKAIKVRDVAQGYADNAENGVVAYGGNLDIRPPYQREFVYDDKKRNAVIDTIQKGFPLNVMYWAETQVPKYEVLDGQQRTLSICKYVKGEFSVIMNGHPMTFHNLPQSEKDRILDYELMVYQCSGTDKEKLDWFRIINIAGERLTEQELRNAVYTGPWLSHAKTLFSKPNCVAYLLASDYVQGSPIRQEILETAISWVTPASIDAYMASHQSYTSADAMWEHFQKVIKWVKTTFIVYRKKEMKGLPWGELYASYGGKYGAADAAGLESRIKKLMADDDVTNKRGIYPYVLSGDPKHLSIRTFSDAQRRAAYERQNGVCPVCSKHFGLEAMEADHITPWSKGGQTNAENCQMLCLADNRRKGAV